MRVAVIDLGTNTFNLLIADTQLFPAFKVLHSSRAVVKLGEGTIQANIISAIPFERGINSLIEFSKIIREFDVSETIAFATSGIRTASNGSEFINRAKAEAGIHIETITGEQEAELIFKGNRLAVPMGKEKHLIFDIGGGSNEFIIADDDKYYYKASFKLGVARLLNKFNPEDPISDLTVEQIFSFLDNELEPLINEAKNYQIKSLIGSSGGFESVIDMLAARFDSEKIQIGKTNYRISLSQYREMSKVVRSSTLEQRKSMPGLIEMRQDMIVLTYLLIDHILNKFEIENFKVSAYSLKEGILADWKEKKIYG